MKLLQYVKVRIYLGSRHTRIVSQGQSRAGAEHCETSCIGSSSDRHVCVLVSNRGLDLLRPSHRRYSPDVTQEHSHNAPLQASQQALTFPVLFGSPPPFRYVNITSTSPVSAARKIFNAPTIDKEGDREPRFPAPWELSLREIADGHRTGTFADGANIITQLCKTAVFGSSGLLCRNFAIIHFCNIGFARQNKGVHTSGVGVVLRPRKWDCTVTPRPASNYSTRTNV